MKRLAYLVVAALLALGGQARADLSEDQAKAGLIYNLTKFVQWPQAPADRTLNLCVYREDSILPVLASLRDKSSRGLTLRVQRADTTEESRSCQVLFVGRAEQANLRPLLRALRGQPVLVLSDIPDSAASGATLEVFLDGNHLAFRINRAAANEAGLKLSAQLLGLAKAIYD